MTANQRNLVFKSLITVGQLSIVIATLGFLTEKFGATSASVFLVSGVVLLAIPLYIHGCTAKILSTLTEFNSFQIVSILGAWSTNEFKATPFFWMLVSFMAMIYIVVYLSYKDM